MKSKPFENLSPVERRHFLKIMGSLLSAPLVSQASKYAFYDILLGPKAAEAQVAGPMNFIEINLRDQWDFGHTFVAPGLATSSSLNRGFRGSQIALAQDPNTLTDAGNGFYLTSEGASLQPHLDSIAVLEVCELARGTIHGHEAANATRSPGRDYSSAPGKTQMWLKDPRTKQGGNENHWSSTPTPAVIHNAFVKSVDSDTSNGVVYKGIQRPIHTVYHFEASLLNADLDRYSSTSSLIQRFTGVEGAVASTLGQHSDVVSDLIRRVDDAYLTEKRYQQMVRQNHQLQLAGAKLGTQAKPNFNLALSDQERSYWREGFGPRGGPGAGSTGKAHLWEQAAYATKLIAGGVVRTVALEYDFIDIHGSRNEQQMRQFGVETALTLSRMIEQLKAAGVYDNTIIAMYTTDGGRSPEADSWGNRGKNGLILAGGGVRGGYFGDIRSLGGSQFSYHRPDASGNPVANGNTGNGGRVAGAEVWRTVNKALGMPVSFYGQYPDVAGFGELNFMLKS